MLKWTVFRLRLSVCCFGWRRSVSAKIPDSSWKTVHHTSWIFCLMPTSICVLYWANMRRTRGWPSSVRMTTLKSTSTAWWRNPNEPSDCSKRGRRGCMRSNHRTGNRTSFGFFLPFFLVSFVHVLEGPDIWHKQTCFFQNEPQSWLWYPAFTFQTLSFRSKVFCFCRWEHFCSLKSCVSQRKMMTKTSCCRRCSPVCCGVVLLKCSTVQSGCSAGVCFDMTRLHSDISSHLRSF